MQTGLWPCPGSSEEYALSFDRGRKHRLLVVRALFDEGSSLRHFTVEVMRQLDAHGVDTFLPDLPGTNESLVPLELQTLNDWKEAIKAASDHFGPSHMFTLRGGALIASDSLPVIQYAPASGASLLRAMLRAKVLTLREAGRDDTREDLFERGQTEGLRLAGYKLGPAMIADLQNAEIPHENAVEIAQGDVGGAGLWLQAEPAHDARQAETLARLVLERLR
ncbi:hypothetical protein [Aurantiacibacter poecillastricola]|uniref:hypothetical protein n=1 Tax=Aurantiacibacter poecillastricola TaxID=3064385 RepID=UPI00273DFF75|nr:hypothetical protein [Aurantiacibacter sp. 219JJ12-13]MDP5262170.1 hypothetical protein [Aurantiacibacter sp. 219JJ12-13]